jgi:hypothetical protein
MTTKKKITTETTNCVHGFPMSECSECKETTGASIRAKHEARETERKAAIGTAQYWFDTAYEREHEIIMRNGEIERLRARIAELEDSDCLKANVICKHLKTIDELRWKVNGSYVRTTELEAQAGVERDTVITTLTRDRDEARAAIERAEARFQQSESIRSRKELALLDATRKLGRYREVVRGLLVQTEYNREMIKELINEAQGFELLYTSAVEIEALLKHKPSDVVPDAEALLCELNADGQREATP